MDSPSLDSPRPTLFSLGESEAGDGSRVVDTTDRPTESGVVLIAGFGNPVAADYAAFVSQRSRADAVVIADFKLRPLVEAPVRLVAHRRVLQIDGKHRGRIRRDR